MIGIADSVSGDVSADGVDVINVGNVNVNVDDAVASALCLTSVVSNLSVSVSGSALAGSSFGTGLLGGGLNGVVSGLTTDVSVLANVLVLF